MEVREQRWATPAEELKTEVAAHISPAVSKPRI
jgi:hypothetical protein